MIDGLLTGAAALLASLVTWASLRGGRVRQLERRVENLDQRMQLLWLHYRRAVDLYYRHRNPGAPDLEDLPDSVFELTTTE